MRAEPTRKKRLTELRSKKRIHQEGFNVCSETHYMWNQKGLGATRIVYGQTRDTRRRTAIENMNVREPVTYSTAKGQIICTL